MKAIVFDHIGAPADVLYLSDLALREIGEDEVLVRMVAASVIPGDFLFIQNMYPEPKKPVFPKQISGNHGAGIVESAGRDAGVLPGTFVFFTFYNSWAEYAIVPAKWLIPLPADYPPLKASQLVNLITAWDLVALSGVKAGQWLVLTAGYSSVSLMAAQFARRLGIKVISIVRHLQQEAEQSQHFADEVIELSSLKTSLISKLLKVTANSGINGVIDNVGGPALEELIKSTAFGSKIIINGNMSLDKFTLHNNDILFNGIEIKPYIYRYLLSPPQLADQPFLKELIAVSADPGFEVRIGGTHRLEDFALAVSGTLYDAGKGKQVFVF
jgi:NADPH2:quinone reductase